MTVRITVTEDESRTRVIRLEGRLTGDECAALEEVVGSDAKSACLDLSGLRAADALGLAGLRRLRASGIALQGVPPLLAWRIEDEGT